MTKNEIINKIVSHLLDQRETLNLELSSMNHNESSFMDRRTTLESQIQNIDLQLDRRVQDCEMLPQA